MNPKNNDIVWYDIGVSEACAPADPLPEAPTIPRQSLVVITGRAPIWRYAIAFHALHASPAGAIATYDPRLGVVIVASHTRAWTTGDVLDLTPPTEA